MARRPEVRWNEGKQRWMAWVRFPDGSRQKVERVDKADANREAAFASASTLDGAPLQRSIPTTRRRGWRCSTRPSRPQPRAVRHRPRRPNRHRPPYPHPRCTVVRSGAWSPRAARRQSSGRNHILWTWAPTHRGIGHADRRKETTVTLRKDQGLLLYTDGLIEQLQPDQPDQR